MGGGQAYEQGTHASASNHVRQVAGDLQTELNQLANKLDAMHGGWAGKAAAKFHEVRARWSDDTVQLINALNNIADLLQQVGATYDASEDNEQSTFSNILSSLNTK
jgi:WXG100 family type VII secretion target